MYILLHEDIITIHEFLKSYDFNTTKYDKYSYTRGCNNNHHKSIHIHIYIHLYTIGLT